MKRTLTLTFPVLIAGFGLMALALSATGAAVAQSVAQEKLAQEKPEQRSRQPLPTPPGGPKGFENYAVRDASSRLIAGAGTRRVAPRKVAPRKVLDPATPHYDQGKADYRAGKYKEAVEEFSEAVRLKPDWVEAHYALALSLTEIEKLPEAIEEFRQVVKFNANEDLQTLSFYNLGNAHLDLGQYKEAIESYREAIKLRPDLSKPHNNLGLAYAASGQLAEAISEFKQAAQLRADYAEAHFNLGVAYLQLGNQHEAEKQQQLPLTVRNRN